MNDLSRSAGADRDRLMNAVSRVVDSGWYVLGPEVQAFEAALASYVGAAHAVGVASGTDALEISLTAVARPGAVLTAANAGGYTTVAARRCGYEVRYADVDPATHCLSPSAVAHALSNGGIGAVVLTHLYGRLADVRAVALLCEKAGVPLVEDCAQAIGAARGDQRGGAVGDIAAFSFYPTKNLGALGDGGAVATSSAEVAERVRKLRQYGWERKYVVSAAGGCNSRLDELQAAVLSERLPGLDRANARRREIITAYAAAAKGGPLEILGAEGPDHVGHLAVGITDEREAVRAALAERGVSTDVHYPVPDHQQPAWTVNVSLPVTESLAARVLSLPCFPELTDAEVEQVLGAIESL